ncbi:urea ABC transporter permease subunit UrtB [Opitutales bacterium ASA1]|uniref:urea ABC transporter permease subunit UrtB n=1 Tax=Congregicoccus parvus TaxID=3081749 RepID=UPI002B2D5252|nr:urea ABC transporter permease subunit UrtB [Opitutales bacterium ASA1]
MSFSRVLFAAALFVLLELSAFAAEPPRETIARAVLAPDTSTRRDLISSLAGKGDEDLAALLDAWRVAPLYVYESEITGRVAVQLVGPKDGNGAQDAIRVDDGSPLVDAAGTPLRLVDSTLASVRITTPLRAAIKSVLDLLDLNSPVASRRIDAIKTLGFSQDTEKEPLLRERLDTETDSKVRIALREAIALIHLASADKDTRLAALGELRELHTLSSYGLLESTFRDAQASGDTAIAEAARVAIRAVDSHRAKVDFLGTLFRGVSLGSILLVVALGLAITFGLMGVINMAHGEMIAVGAYTTYVVQNLFGAGLVIPFFGMNLGLPGMNLQGWGYQTYFIFALPVSFLAAAVVGIGLERSVIQFLYRRPLESLLATWGVSLVLQQIFRLMFGANNVQVSSPSYLSGNWTIDDVTLGWNRVFVIGFAILLVFGVWLVLTKTPLGLLIRAVMQNRRMAACMGVRTERVNMLTFGLGSGLAGLAGAFVSQINNVGPALGQSYIVDSFMVVVVGGVGNVLGTVISALGIGAIDNVFQQYLPAWVTEAGAIPWIGNFLQNLGQDSAVFGKILVLAGIILFLQWRPAGIFVTRSRNLEG